MLKFSKKALLLSLSLKMSIISSSSFANVSKTPTPACINSGSDEVENHPLWMNIVGISATALGFASSLPAIIHVFKTKDVGGLSPVAFGIGTITILLSGVYNIALRNPILIAGSTYGLLINGLFFFAMFKFRKAASLTHIELSESEAVPSV